MGAPVGNCNAAKNKSACRANKGSSWGRKSKRLHGRDWVTAITRRKREQRVFAGGKGRLYIKYLDQGR